MDDNQNFSVQLCEPKKTKTSNTTKRNKFYFERASKHQTVRNALVFDVPNFYVRLVLSCSIFQISSFGSLRSSNEERISSFFNGVPCPVLCDLKEEMFTLYSQYIMA